MFHLIFVLCYIILMISGQNYSPSPGYIPYGYGYPVYRQLHPPYVEPYMQSGNQQYGSGSPDTYYGSNHPVEVIDVSPEVFQAEMRKLGILQTPSQGDVNNIPPQAEYALYQSPTSDPQLSYSLGGSYYQPSQYMQRHHTPYGVSESRIVSQMLDLPVNISSQDILNSPHASIPYTPNGYQQVPAQNYKASVGHVQPEFTYIPTYQYKNQPGYPVVKKRRNRHRYVIKKDSSQNNGNQSESRVIDKHEIQRKTYTFRKTFVVTPEKRPSGPITINLVNGIPITTANPEEITVTTIPTTTTEDNEIPEDTTGFLNLFNQN